MNKRLILSDNLFLLVANDIDEICKPLKMLGITYFTYLKAFSDGSQVYLSNSARWIEEYFNLGLYKSSSFENNPNHFCSGYFIWPKEDPSAVYLHGRESFNSDNGITLIQKSETSCDFYFFSGSINATWLNNFYLNNIDLLEKFIIYFKDTAGKLIRKAEKNRIVIPKCEINAASSISHGLYPPQENISDLRSAFLRKINSDELMTSKLSSCDISSREKEVAFNILRGKTARETAEKLIISRKTVERHIENMKIKLQCANKAELIKRLLTLEGTIRI